MDKQSQEKLASILTKEVGALSEEEKGFLRARRSYLSETETEKYSEVLEVAQAKKEKVVEVEEEAKPKKKTKKK